jgi:uncharacterized OB-fold protein
MDAAKPKPQAPLTVSPYLQTSTAGDVRLLATHCTSCGYNTFPPSGVCPECMSLEVEPLALSETGLLYSYTTLRHGAGTTFGGYVDFPERIRVFGHLKGFTPEQPPACDMPVRIVPAAPVEGARTSAPVDFNFEAAEPLPVSGSRS